MLRVAIYCQVQEPIEVLQGLYLPDVTGLAFSLLGSSTKEYSCQTIGLSGEEDFLNIILEARGK